MSSGVDNGQVYSKFSENQRWEGCKHPHPASKPLKAALSPHAPTGATGERGFLNLLLRSNMQGMLSRNAGAKKSTLLPPLRWLSPEGNIDFAAGLGPQTKQNKTKC